MDSFFAACKSPAKKKGKGKAPTTNPARAKGKARPDPAVTMYEHQETLRAGGTSVEDDEGDGDGNDASGTDNEAVRTVLGSQYNTPVRTRPAAIRGSQSKHNNVGKLRKKFKGAAALPNPPESTDEESSDNDEDDGEDLELEFVGPVATCARGSNNHGGNEGTVKERQFQVTVSLAHAS